MAVVDVGGSSLPADSEPKLFGLVWRLAAIMALSLHSSSERGELSQWLSAVMTAPQMSSCHIIIIIIKSLFTLKRYSVFNFWNSNILKTHCKAKFVHEFKDY